MNKHVEQILAAGNESKYLKTKYRNFSQLTAVLISLIAVLIVYIVSSISAQLLGIDSEIPLKTQENHQVWLAILFVSIPLSVIPGYCIITPIFSALLVKLNWLNKQESVIFKKYVRFPQRCLKDS
jgi:type III secretory pathway component EscV